MLCDKADSESSETNVEEQDPLESSPNTSNYESNHSQSGQIFEEVDSLPTAPINITSEQMATTSSLNANTNEAPIDSVATSVLVDLLQTAINANADESAIDPTLMTENSVSQTSPITADVLSTALDSALVIVGTQPSIKNEPIFEQMNEKDARAVEGVFNASYENYGSDDAVMIHRSDPVPKPIADQNPYQVKVNDALSGKILFALTVSSFHRIY